MKLNSLNHQFIQLLDESKNVITITKTKEIYDSTTVRFLLFTITIAILFITIKSRAERECLENLQSPQHKFISGSSRYFH